MSQDEKSLSPDDARVIATAVIWICFTILTIIVLSSSPHIFNFMLGVFAFILAGFSTHIIWSGKIADDNIAEKQKLKNADRNIDAAALVLQLLNDDERSAVRQRLLNNSDGEIPQFFAEDVADEDSIGITN